jgi:pSer/pThr/pTyr-binding forkhead associated (FHA) protein
MSEIHLVPLAAPATEVAGSAPVVITEFPCLIGRAPMCTHRLDNPLISRRHCVFWLRNGQVWLEDLGSSNGTRLNEELLTSARPVSDGDLLDLAHLPFRLEVADAATGTARSRQSASTKRI